jgi:hypothetical protein
MKYIPLESSEISKIIELLVLVKLVFIAFPSALKINASVSRIS